MLKNKRQPMETTYEDVYKFGAKCYRQGYRRATLELYAGIVYSAIILGVPVAVKAWKNRKNKKTVSEEKTES